MGFICFYQLKKHTNRYILWLRGNKDIDSSVVVANVPLSKNLLRKLVLKIFIIQSQPSGYGVLASFSTSTLFMYPTNLDPFASQAYKMMKQAIQVYKNGMYDSINPIYWTDFIIFLPKALRNILK